MRRLWLLLLLMVSVFPGADSATSAARQARTCGPDTTNCLLESARIALESSAYDEAVLLLEPLYAVSRESAVQRGEIVYLYGEALHGAGRADDALAMWSRELDEAAELDVTLANAFIQDVFGHAHRRYYDSAEALFFRLIGGLDDSGGDQYERSILQKYLDEMMPVLPPVIRERLDIGAEDRSFPVSLLPEGAGAVLVAWWRRADFLPTTSLNERLVEHLERSVFARDRLTDREGTLDDRGRVFIRYGEPARVREIRGDRRSVHSISRQQSRGSQSVLNARETVGNQFWVYSQVHQSAHFLFLLEEDTGGYRMGEASELLPRTWAGTARRSGEFLQEMEALYEELALDHADYSLIYSDVANYNTSARSGVPGATAQSPRSFSVNAYSEGLALDYHIQEVRENVLPPSFTNVREDVERIPIESRIARFLEDDGDTRVELIWGTTVEALLPDRRSRRDLRRYGADDAPEALSFLMVTGAELRNSRGESLDRMIRRYAMGPYGSERGLLAPTVTTLNDVKETADLVLQWDVHVIDESGSVGPLVKFQTEGPLEVTPLRRASGSLEASDLRPFVVTTPGIPADVREVTPYPFRNVTVDVGLGVYYELYHLETDPRGRKSYAIEYSIRSEGRRLEHKNGAASVSVSLEADDSTVRDFLLVDLQEWSATGQVELVLEFTDNATGASVRRSIDLMVSGG